MAQMAQTKWISKFQRLIISFYFEHVFISQVTFLILSMTFIYLLLEPVHLDTFVQKCASFIYKIRLFRFNYRRGAKTIYIYLVYS